MLAGAALLVLYELYGKILALPVFSNVGPRDTASLIGNIVGKLFWLALVALILGTAGYLTTAILTWMNPGLRSNLKLEDASLDPNLDLNRQLSTKAKRASQKKAPRQ
jgi:hypothetical protein